MISIREDIYKKYPPMIVNMVFIRDGEEIKIDSKAEKDLSAQIPQELATSIKPRRL